MFKNDNWNIKDYSEIVNFLKYFLPLQSTKKLNNGEYLFEYQNNWFRLSDNGGETNIDLINAKQPFYSIPHTSNKFEVTPLVLAYRIATYLKNGYSQINWNIIDEDLKNVITKYNDSKAIWFVIENEL